MLPVDVLLDVTVAEAELVALDVEPEDDPLPVPVLVPLLVADARALGVTDVVWLEVVDVLALVGTDVEPADDPVSFQRRIYSMSL